MLVARSRSSLRSRPIAGGGYAETHVPFDILLVRLRKMHIARSSESAEALRDAVTELESKGIALYDRLALHLLRTHGHMAPDLVVERAIDQKRIAGAQTDSEIALMICDRFAGLVAADQSRVLDALRGSSSVETLRVELGDRFSDEEHNLYARERSLVAAVSVLDHAAIAPARVVALSPRLLSAVQRLPNWLSG